MIEFGEKKTITLDGKECSYYDSIFGVRVEVVDEKKFDRQGLLKLHGANTYKPTYILLSTWTIKKGLDKVKEVLIHEFSHIIYHTILKDSIYEKIDKTDLKMSKYEYWDGLSKYINSYISSYASTHTAEDFAENIAASYYINNNIALPNKFFSFNKEETKDKVRFKWIIANNLFKHGLEQRKKEHNM